MTPSKKRKNSQFSFCTYIGRWYILRAHLSAGVVVVVVVVDVGDVAVVVGVAESVSAAAAID